MFWNISERRKIIFADLHWKNNPAPIMHKDLEENKKQRLSRLYLSSYHQQMHQRCICW
jgi:hypothetical protein